MGVKPAGGGTVVIATPNTVFVTMDVLTSVPKMSVVVVENCVVVKVAIDGENVVVRVLVRVPVNV